MSRAGWRRFTTGACAAVLLGVLTLSGALNSPASAAGFQVLSPSAAAFPQHVDWVTVCKVVRHAAEDPIVFPGVAPSPHDHTFSGNAAVNPTSTAEQLVTQRTNCGNSGDTASYWMPTLLVDGKPLMPYATRAYYRAATRDTTKLHAIPFGLRIVAGDAMATSPQNSAVAGFQCRIEGQGATVDKQSLPPRCGSNALFEASVVFPNCWDGVHLDSADHKSHMSYAKNFVCDAAHPVQLPQLTLAERFMKGTTAGTVTLAAMNSPLTLHADFLNAWKPAAMAELMKRCIYAHVFCEDVSDTRMPPGMRTTVPADPAAAAAAATPSSPAVQPTTSASPTSASAPKPAGTTAGTPSGSSTASSPSGSAAAPAVSVARTATTTLTIVGTSFPMHLPAKVTVTSGGSSRSAVTQTGHDGKFSVAVTIPSTWSGLVRVSASADSGHVSAQQSFVLR